MYSRILVPVDTTYETSTWLKSSFQRAWDLAQKSGGELHLVAVIPDNLLKGYYPDIYSESVVNDVRRKLETMAKECPTSAPVRQIYRLEERRISGSS